MSDSNRSFGFYDFCYPDSFKPPKKKDHQHVFTDYGCMEACNLEYDESTRSVHFLPKKQKCRSDVDNENFSFTESQPVRPLGKPTPITTTSSFPKFTDFYKENVRTLKNGKYIANIESQLENLAFDHPDVFQGSFLKSIAGFVPSISTLSVAKLNKLLISPYELDVSRQLLNKLLVEEILLQSHKLDFDEDYAGGCLCYQPMSKNNGFDYGFLVGAYNDINAQLNIKLLCTDTRTREDEDHSFDSEIQFPVNIYTSSEYKSILSCRVLQVDTSITPNHPGLCFIGCRSDYRALMLSLNRNEIQERDQSLKFNSDSVVRELGSIKSNSVISSMCMNPYIGGQCSIATTSGNMYIWDISVKQNASVYDENSSSLQKIKLLNEKSKWFQMEHAAHPRQLFVADRYDVNVVDCRINSNSALRILHSLDHMGDEQIMTIKSNNQFSDSCLESLDKSYQCLVASQTRLCLFDQRHCKLPLLQWSLNMRRPCQHLVHTTLPHTNNQIADSSSLIIAANQLPQEIHCYQYRSGGYTDNNFSGLFTNTPNKLPPRSVSSVKSLDGFKHFQNVIKSHPIQLANSSVLHRLSQPVVGLAAYNYQTNTRNAGVMILQASGTGDILYQPLSLSPVEDQDATSTLRNNKTSFDPLNANSISNAARNEYISWARESIKKETKEQSHVYSRSTRNKLNTVQFSFKKLSSDIIDQFDTLKSSSKCELCRDRCFDLNKRVVNLHVDEDTKISDDDEYNLAQRTVTPENIGESNTCQACGLEYNYVGQLVNAIQSRHVLTRERVKMDQLDFSENFLDEAPPQEVPQLNLIDNSEAVGVGRVLAATWDGTYEDMWESFKEEKKHEEQEEKIRNAHAMLDIHTGHVEENV